MILKAFDNDCGVIAVSSLEDIYKVADLGVDETIKSYSIEKEGNFITVTYVTAKDKEFKFAMYEDEEFDLGLSTKPTSYIYMGGHTKIDTVFSEGQSYPIVRTKEDGAIVLKAGNGKGFSIPQKFIDMYFEPSSETSRLDKVIDMRGQETLEDDSMDGGIMGSPGIGEEMSY